MHKYTGLGRPGGAHLKQLYAKILLSAVLAQLSLSLTSVVVFGPLWDGAVLKCWGMRGDGGRDVQEGRQHSLELKDR